MEAIFHGHHIVALTVINGGDDYELQDSVTFKTNLGVETLIAEKFGAHKGSGVGFRLRGEPGVIIEILEEGETQTKKFVLGHHKGSIYLEALE